MTVQCETTKALRLLQAQKKSADWPLLSFCYDSKLHISALKYLVPQRWHKRVIRAKYFIGNRFHVMLRILSRKI